MKLFCFYSFLLTCLFHTFDSILKIALFVVSPTISFNQFSVLCPGRCCRVFAGVPAACLALSKHLRMAAWTTGKSKRNNSTA